MNGKIYLIPNTLGDSSVESVLPSQILHVASHIYHFIVENEKNARRFLIKLGIPQKIDELTFYELNKHTPRSSIHGFLKPALDGKPMGVISEAGVPGVADPGAEIIRMAHHYKLPVVPLVGPSSILLSLMASGLNGQNFAFNGYLPVKRPQRIQSIKKLEKKSAENKQTQLFIETPYRNNALIEDIFASCNPNTWLCIACDITLPTEYIVTRQIKDWKRNIPDLHKRPAIFLILQER